ncbi:MAG: ECF transporter S component [Caldilineaceae bacterium]
MQSTSSGNTLSVRRIAMTGILAAIAIFLGATRLGFIPVPNLSGNATIMHVPAIIGGVLEGPIVGLLVGGIFGLYSFLQATSPLFKDPLVAILPRLFIGVTAYYSYIAFRKQNEIVALGIAGAIGTLTNTVLVVGMILWRHLNFLNTELNVGGQAFVISLIPQAIAEIVIAVVITIAVVAAWKRIESGGGKSSI